MKNLNFSAPGDPSLAPGQDTKNFKRQRAGLQAALKTGQTLGNYQEVHIRHFHQTLDDYLERRP